MSDRFRELLKKVGSGENTHRDLTREEAAIATRMMLQQEATPAQIGAFMISHRIKRPTPVELAGMLDAYDELGPQLQLLPNNDKKVVVFGIPYDGRSRTAPVTIITALILATFGIPVIMHGGDCMPTKYGVPLIDIWRGLGLDLSQLSLAKAGEMLAKTSLGFVYLPRHFQLANDLVTYREQIGKRPPAATVELIWSPYPEKQIHLLGGYVHPPTEARFRTTFKLREITDFTLVKGLEGSCDLRRSQTNIIVINNSQAEEGFEYLKIDPHDYGFASKDVELQSTSWLVEELEKVLQGKASELRETAIWNGGFCLWRFGVCGDISEGLVKVEEAIASGKVNEKRSEIKEFLE